METDAPRFVIYRDMELHAALDYDPLAAVERMTETVAQRDLAVADLMDQVSDREAQIIELTRELAHAWDSSNLAKGAAVGLRVKIAETKRTLRQFANDLFYANKYRRK